MRAFGEQSYRVFRFKNKIFKDNYYVTREA